MKTSTFKRGRALHERGDEVSSCPRNADISCFNEASPFSEEKKLQLEEMYTLGEA
jgi:hypothetical protein